ncbi:PQQ-dependent sugar dehydrogenase [Pseudorhodobacter ferrugineus]|uniref:PQQ-dependent sugar dehydrogenase n=1 Tax=Pseudorhodobacter ferrugineus TaxID=77008 RepID=UPI0003B4014F|nr:PQQ-dependent sugar dehydrogenase [Pseudorhodobacter ferrugineus]
MSFVMRFPMNLQVLSFWQPCIALALGAMIWVTQGQTAVAQNVQVTQIANGFEEPWAIGFLPGGDALVTERDGRLLRLPSAGGAMVPVNGVPQVAATGQGGLLDVMVPRDFAATRRIWLSYAAPVAGGAGTAAGFGRLSDDGMALEGFRAVMEPVGRAGGRHFGARLVEALDGTVFLTTGDRGDGDLAQALDGPEGKVLHFFADGAPLTAPEFAGKDVFPGLYSYGHRNIQGAALDREGRLMTAEHGARGGDEVNAPVAGRNYGWPIITYGRDYSGLKIGEGTAKDGMEQPLFYWDPSIAPSGLMVYDGALFPDWRGQVFTGSLNSDLIARLDPANGFAEARVTSDETTRVRDIRQAPDGSIWFLSVYDGAIYRIAP